MDITFTGKCGQEIAIEEAGAGITVDCPGCGKPVYVPSIASDKSKDPPLRVETPLAKLARETGQPLTPSQNAPPPNPRPATTGFTPRRPDDVHPAIQASLICLVILAGFGLVGLIVLRENMLAVVTLFYMATPFITAAPLCAIYGMCVGHVRHGLLLLGAMSLMIGLSHWVFFRESMAMLGASQQQIQQMMQQQMQQFQKQIPQFPHP
ncbi:MAG TPA: hypothetical protein VL171_01685 [Verrucomicrobiae bacterium]|nr:hypothetical protein [Verrucomicrobiae bacterium]